MKILAKNRLAYHDYGIEKEYTAGMVLEGHEVKSIKLGQVNIKDAVIVLDQRELWIVGMDVPLYAKTSHALVPGYQPKGRRKLLINKKEFAKISAACDKSGIVLIPLQVIASLSGKIKLIFGVAKLMRKVEKKQILKEKDVKKQMDREIKNLRM